MDTPSQESSTTPLNTNTAAEAFAAVLDPVEPDKEQTADSPEAVEEQQPDEAPEEAVEEGEGVTIEVDGKTVTLTKAELAEAYKSGLRQSDYTRKTMEAAEQRRAAEAELSAARQERQKYAEGLTQAQALLQAQLQQQSQIDWQQLLESDPVEYLKQQHLAQTRQAQLAQIAQAQQEVFAKEAQEMQARTLLTLQQQQEVLLAKLPEWKDGAKSKAEREAIKAYLRESAYGDDEINGIQDHRAVILARKAMLYDQMMGKASAATKKVAQAPTRVLSSGSGTAPRIDGRSRAMQALGKSGRVEDAAAAFASIL